MIGKKDLDPTLENDLGARLFGYPGGFTRALGIKLDFSKGSGIPK